MMEASRWRPSDDLELEPNALAAIIETKRSLALTAGPGAGKTELLAQRADFLLRSGFCRYPLRILAISFKVDAARNLRERVYRRFGTEASRRVDSHTFHAFAKRLIDRFRPVLTGKDALDADYTIGSPRVQRRQIEFQDLVPLAVKILQTSDIARNAVRETYSHVFLDEFQDCTGEQYSLVRTAFLGAGALVTAVGDTKQRIMGWAGALEGIFETFAVDFDAIALNLYQNFRSLPRLRRMQNAMVKVMDPGAAVDDDALAGEGGSVEVICFQDSQQEAEALSSMISSWIGHEGLPPSEIAVLVSRQPELYAKNLMLELSRQGVPFRNEQDLQDLAVEPAARLIVDFLTVVVAEREPEAYGRLMNVLVATGIDDDSAYLRRSKWNRYIDEVRIRVRSDPAVEEDAAMLCRTAAAFLEVLGRESMAALLADYERGTRLDQVIAQTYERITALRTDGADAKGALSRFSEDSAVRIMTIHKAKGLEFDSVIVLAVEQQTFWGNPAEERSAFFVGISRAKRRLCLTVAEHRERPTSFGGRWDGKRSPHEEFLSYATATN